MTNSELHSVIDQLSEFQIEQLRKIAGNFLAVNVALSNTMPKSCPCCGSKESAFIMKGFSNRKQRYQCKECDKKFTFNSGKITEFSQ